MTDDGRPKRGDNTASLEWDFDAARDEEKAAEVLRQVYTSLRQRGYDPVKQLVGYLLSGDPTYITEHEGARAAVQTMERDELLGELVDFYLARMS